MIDILKLLEDNNIDYVTEGKNTKRGEVSVCCPFCPDDPSYHMGINLDTGVYGCWRNSQHRSKHLPILLAKLINCSRQQAEQLYKAELPILDNFSTKIDKVFSNKKDEDLVKNKSPIKLLPSFRQIKKVGTKHLFWNYLVHRGLSNPQDIIDRYNIKCCLAGNWKNRLIFPMYLNKMLVTWSSRLITGSQMKYKDLGIDESIVPPKRLLYDIDNLTLGGKALFITEGVFDCFKLRHYLPPQYQVTCVFTKSITSEQIIMLSSLKNKYKQLFILLDNDASVQSIQLKHHLAFITNLSIKFLPKGVKDPGEMKEKDVLKLTH
jgi:hypothetical protein